MRTSDQCLIINNSFGSIGITTLSGLVIKKKTLVLFMLNIVKFVVDFFSSIELLCFLIKD